MPTINFWQLARRVTAAVVLTAGLTSPVLADEVRGVYLPSFSFASTNEATCKANIDNVITKLVAYNFNALYIQVRSRGDAYYFPNRTDSTYPNTEPRGESYSIPANFDPLQYAIDKGHENGIKVIAWLTTYPTWNSGTPPDSPAHVYNAHPEWITQDVNGNFATTAEGEYASLCPGRQDVQDYIYNVFMDVVRNYDVDGIHFDYIRLPENDLTSDWSKFGFNTGSLAKFQQETGFTYDPATDTGKVAVVYQQWMREQIDNLAKRVWEQTKREKPWVEVSAFIVNFANSPKILAQSYNMWTNRGHFDYIVGGSYSDGASIDTAWTRESEYIKIPGTNTLSRPIVFAAGSDTGAFGNTVTTIQQTVTNVRAKSPAVSGFAHFAYAGLRANSDELFHALADSGNPYATPANYPGPSVMNALSSPDTAAPNAPAGAAATLGSTSVQVSFNRPAAAADGDHPVQYRIYRDDVNPPQQYHENLAMVFWDSPSTRTSFSWTDNNPLAGTSYYSIVAYDDWNNAASTVIGPYATTSGEIIIETRTGGKNVANFSGSGLSDTDQKSTAFGVTPGIGSKFSSNAVISASGTFDLNGLISTPGTYDCFITIGNASNANNIDAQNTEFSITGGPTGTIPMLWSNSAITNNWYEFASEVSLDSSKDIVISEQAPQANRFCLDAIRLVPASATVWESKPLLYDFPSNTNVGATVIADDGAGHGGSASTVSMLNYDDSDSLYSTSGFGTNYNSGLGNNARYADAASEKPTKSVFSLDLPVDGQYDIHAYATNGGYTTTAKYQFMAYTDISLTTQVPVTVTATQNYGTAGFNIIADGQASAANSYWFKKGKVYVAVWDDAANTQIVRNDALRFTLVTFTPVTLSNFQLD